MANVRQRVSTKPTDDAVTVTTNGGDDGGRLEVGEKSFVGDVMHRENHNLLNMCANAQRSAVGCCQRSSCLNRKKISLPNDFLLLHE